MVRASLLAAALCTASFASAQCGSGTPDAIVDGEGTFTATVGSEQVYSGSDYFAAIEAALGGITGGQRLSVLASGSIGDNIISVGSGITFEGCGTIDVGYVAGHGAIESLDTSDVQFPYLSMTGAPYFGFRFYGVSGLHLGEINLNLSGGMGIRFERDEAPNSDVSMGTITVNGAGSHAVEVWNINGLSIDSVIATNVGECGLLLQTSTNVQVGYVEGNNVAAGTGYATLRMANNNGQLPDGSYTTTNVFVDRVVSRGGGRGIFCVSMSGAAEIGSIELEDNGGNAILIENCYNISILDGTVSGGGEVRVSARDEFPNTSGVFVELEVNGNTVRESPCAENIFWGITGDAALEVC
ncbi:hypothetical protein S40293_03648 [Stachybotrys chartarum IBT 40293]|nr:hypothetical protein S40293_03648 [Stachybotrys chartarum IBT 40293]